MQPQSLVGGTRGLAGAAAASSLGELGYAVKCFTFHDSPRRAHSIAAQVGINAAKNYNWLLLVPVTIYFVLIFIIQSVIQNSVISFNFYLVNTLDKYTLISLIIFGLGFSCLLFLMKWIFEQQLGKNFFVFVLLFGFVGLAVGYWMGEEKSRPGSTPTPGQLP